MWDIILEALIDSLKTLPILLIVYILIEFLEHKDSVKFEKLVTKNKKLGPLMGAGLGCIPQCGFSAVMADLFSRKMITIGTLFAVFIATSDEAFAILISNPNYIGSVVALIVSKLALAIFFGYLIDIIFKNKKLEPDILEHNKHSEHEGEHINFKVEKKEEHCNCSAPSEKCASEEKQCSACVHNHLHHKHELDEEKTKSKSKVFWDVILEALKHTLVIFCWILGANIIFGIVFQIAGGSEALKVVMGTNAWYQPIICALIGLVPNCVSSVALVELYMENIITFASCLGGLCSGAGMGLIILFKNNRNIKQNLLIVLSLFLLGAVVGLVFNLFLPIKI